MIISLRSISFPIIFLLFVSAIFDPQGGMFGLKNMVILFSSAYLIISLIISDNIHINKTQLSFLLWFSIFLPLYGIINATFRKVGFSEFIDTSYIGSSILFLFTFLYSKENIRFALNSFIYVIRILSLVVISVLLFSFFFETFNIVWFFVQHDAAFFGMRNIGPFKAYYIFFVASPLLIYLYFHDLLKLIENKNFFNLIFFSITVTALILTGNRMNMLIMFLSLSFLPYLLIKKLHLKILFYLILVACILLLISINLDVLINYFKSIFGTDTRFQYFTHYISIFNDTNFIFGQGFNAHIWSSESLALVNPQHTLVHASKVELTYLEFIRVFGIINFFIFISFLCYILKELWKVDLKDKWLFYGLLFYLAGSFSNPNLFSIVGMIPLGLVFAYARLNKRLTTSLN
jgi:hypothetical protein